VSINQIDAGSITNKSHRAEEKKKTELVTLSFLKKYIEFRK